MDQGYKMVADRHAQFVIDNPNGLVNSELVLSQIRNDNESYDEHGPYGFIVMKVEVWKNREDADAGKRPDGVGHASMPVPGTTNFTRNSEVENAETSALGRALAMIGYHAKDTMASEDEIAAKSAAPAPTRKARPVAKEEAGDGITPAERSMLMNWGKKVFGSRDDFLKFLKDEFNILSGKDITFEQLKAIKTAIAIHGATKGESLPSGVSLDE
jgi:hypothetical protein